MILFLVLVVLALIVAVPLLVITAVRRRYTSQYQFHRRVASREKLDAMAEEARFNDIAAVTIVDQYGNPPNNGVYTGRTCCPTPPNQAHTGMCKNSLMRSGEELWFVND
jgi:hypothetical protein